MQLLLVFLVCAYGLQALESVTLGHNTPTETITNNNTIMNFGVFAKPGCQTHCGDLKIPFPFGIISEGMEDRNCSLNIGFDITCDTSTNPPKAFIKDGNIQIFNISDSELRVSNDLARNCYDQFGVNFRDDSTYTDLAGTPFTFSDANVFTVVGCDDRGSIFQAEDDYLPKGCSTTCHNAEEVRQGECLGTGCCQVSVNVFKYFDVYLDSYNNHTNNTASFDSCGYAFLGEKDKFKFRGLPDLKDAAFSNKTEAAVPLVLDWVVVENKTCAQADNDSHSFTCRYNNSHCSDAGKLSRGYRCSCDKGYEGNPYLSPGCQDIDECADPTKNDCDMNCTNTLGNYTCSCPHGYDADGSRCIAKRSKFPLNKFILGMTFGFTSLVVAINWLYCIIKKRKHSQLKEKFFHQNGGLLLKQQSISKESSSVEPTRVFTDAELKKATNNYAADRILGQGGHGVVFKGILPDRRVIAIKRSKVVDKSEIHQFINEMVILTQVNHRNVVKLLGCCLECEVPLLVYEFVSNGSLFHHVHDIDGGMSWLSLENRLFQILEPRVVKEGTIDQLETAAQLVKRCLSLNGVERPTMKEVTMELEGLRNFNKHPWANQHGHEETENLISSTEAQRSDLYEVQLSSYNIIVHDWEQYSSGTGSLLLTSSSPR